MKTKYLRSLLAGLITILVTSSVVNIAPPVYAQSLQTWSDPTNLSHSGSSTDPVMVIDSDGVIRVIWVDAIDGYKYVESVDGKVWTPPINGSFPFSAEDDSRPTFFADANGLIYIFWRDKDNALYYAQTQSAFLSNSASWRKISKVADSVVAYHAVVDSQARLHLSYVKSLGNDSTGAGVYYSQISSSGLAKTVNIYPSEYFRSLDSMSAHVRISVSDKNNPDNVYVVWDDRPQKRIFMAKSLDAGESWGQVFQVTGPEDFTGIAVPFNIDIVVINNRVLLTWQTGQPDGPCTQYSAWSINGGEQFSQTVKVSDEFPICSQASEFVLVNDDLSVALFKSIDDISLAAWNGSIWSELQNQSEIAAFVNPVTLDSVIFGCQKTSSNANTLYVVGCDKGTGGDIWFTSRALDAVDEWFPPATEWGPPVEVTSIEQKIVDLSSVVDNQNDIHTLWVQPALSGGGEDTATIQYVRWSNESWSSPVSVISGLDGNPVQLNVTVDNQGRLLLAWVDSKTGDMSFSWANVGSANRVSEWNTPQYIPSASLANSSPYILADASGRIIIAYAIPVNEQRGVYFVESDDDGKTWTQPFQAFDAASAGWEIVDQPNISLSGDGRLHLLFAHYSLHGEQRQSAGLYYSQSADGGMTWTAPEAVSDGSVPWSQIITYDRSIVHRLWQEDKQSMLVSLHQVSQDGGLTWNSPSVVSSIGADMSLTSQTMDTAGNLYFLQLINDDRVNIVNHIWNGSGWISEEPKELYIKNGVVPSSLTLNITSNGDLRLFVSVENSYLRDEERNDIISVGRSLQLPELIQTPYAALVPTVQPPSIMTEATSTVQQLPTLDPPSSGLSKAWPVLIGNKNLIGLLLLGGIVLLIVIVFRPLARKQKNQKKSDESN